jgi:hypothetical protein
MQSKLPWTLLAVAGLGGTALASPDVMPAPMKGEAISVSGSRRGVAQDYMVLPHGAELTGAMRFIMSDPVFGDEKLKFSDLAMFTLGGRYSLFSKLELSAHASFLAKQPSITDEKPWQNVGFGLRSPLGKRVALAITGAGGHLIDHSGKWTQQALTLQWRKPVAEILTFDVGAGMDAIGIDAPRSTSAFLTEVAVTGSALFREPHGHWGAWVGMGYAVPVTASGTDPTTGLDIDPQPRLDFKIGTVISLNRWDIFAELAIVDRGDLSNPATRLPVLDGGFDQKQVIMGVTRHIDWKRKSRRRDDDMAMARR